MAHGHAVGHRDGAELARRAAGGSNPLLHCLGLTHQRDIARRGFVPAGGNADKGLMNLLGGQPHGVEVGAMGSARRALSHMTAWQPVLDVGLGVHRNPVSPAISLLGAENRKVPAPFTRAVAMLLRNIISWRGVAKKRRRRARAEAGSKC